jgi:predicted Zn-dependent protease
MKTQQIIFYSILATALAGCRTVPMTSRSQLMLSTASSENELGASAYTEYKEQTKPVDNADQQALLKRVGTAIKDVSGVTDFEWEFNVLESDTVNAFCLPGGKVAVYTGMMTQFANEAELACVVAHEVGHAIARHGGERTSWSYLEAIGTLGVSTWGNDTAQTIYGIGAEYGVMLPYSRLHENEADLIGLYLMAKAGYDPQAAVDFWKKFDTGNSSKLDELLSTHPCDATRVANLTEHLPEAIELYDQCMVKRGLGVRLANGLPVK